MPMAKQDLIEFLMKYNRLLVLRKGIKDGIEKIEKDIEKSNIVPKKVDTRISATIGKYLSGYIVWLVLLTIVFSVVIFVALFIMLIIGDGILPENYFTNMIRPVATWVEEYIPLGGYAIFNMPISSIICAFFISAILSIPCGIPDLKGEKKRSRRRISLLFSTARKNARNETTSGISEQQTERCEQSSSTNEKPWDSPS